MPPRGPKPLPTHIKQLRGTLRQGRQHGREPRVDIEVPACPRELAPEAKREWRRIAPQLARLGLLTGIDRTMLALYCDTYGRWIEAQRALQAYGVVVKSPSGFPMQSPYLAITNKCLEQMRLLLQEFGMSPSSRTRVTAVELGPAEPDDLAQFLAQRRGR